MIINYATAESILVKVEDESKKIGLEELCDFLKSNESEIEDLHMRMIGEREGEDDFVLREEDSLIIGHILNVLDATEETIEQIEDEKGTKGLWDKAAEIAIDVGLYDKQNPPQDDVVYAEEWGQELIYNKLMDVEHRYEIENDKAQLYMKNILVWLDEHFDGEELYNILADKIHMTDEDISNCGFDSLSEYFEDHPQNLTQA